MIAVGLAAMVILPLLYRVWLHYHPQLSEQRTSLSEFLAKSAEACAMQLIQTPLSKWTELDKKSEPRIHAWLVAHENMILPWEWTDEAKRKDPSGHMKMWRAILKEQRRELDKRIDSVQGQIKSIERKLWIDETAHAHRTNQIARIMEYVSTNSFPMTVKVDRLFKGRLWGWNTKSEEVRFEKREDFEGEENGWLATELKQVSGEKAEMAAGAASLKALERRLCIAKELFARAVELENLADLNDSICLVELCHFLKSGETLERN